MISEELFRNIGLALLAVFIITLIVLANLWTCLLVFSCVAFTLVSDHGQQPSVLTCIYKHILTFLCACSAFSKLDLSARYLSEKLDDF